MALGLNSMHRYAFKFEKGYKNPFLNFHIWKILSGSDSLIQIKIMMIIILSVID